MDKESWVGSLKVELSTYESLFLLLSLSNYFSDADDMSLIIFPFFVVCSTEGIYSQEKKNTVYLKSKDLKDSNSYIVVLY